MASATALLMAAPVVVTALPQLSVSIETKLFRVGVTPSAIPRLVSVIAFLQGQLAEASRQSSGTARRALTRG